MIYNNENILFYLYNITSEKWYGGEHTRIPKIWTEFEDACLLDIDLKDDSFSLYTNLAAIMHLVEFNGTDNLILVRSSIDKSDSFYANFEWVIPIDNAELIFKLVEMYGWGDHEWQAIGSV